MDDKIRNYIFTASGSLLKLNDTIREMFEIVSKMDSPKQTKELTRKELTKKLSEASTELLEIAQKTNKLSSELYNPAREQNDEKGQ